MRHAKVGLQLLMDRRAREETNEQYHTAARIDSTSREQLLFENRSRSHFQTRELRRRALQHKEEAEIELDNRRARLYELLRSDDEQHSAEICAGHETPATRRARLKQKLAEIQKKNNEEHEAEVEQRLYNRWLEECDPLRPMISLAFERQVALERQSQLAERDAKALVEDEADRRYAEHVREGVREFRERQAREEEDRRRRQQQNKTAWTSQMQNREEVESHQRQADLEEGMRIRQRNIEDIREAELEAERRRKGQTERKRELDRVNAENDAIRRRKGEEERKQDEAFLRKAREDLRKEREDSMVERLIAKRRANADREVFAQRMSRAMESERETELYVDQVAEEENRKRDEERRRDLEKRRNLMLDATRTQVEQMRDRDERREWAKGEKVVERARVTAEAELQKQREMEEAEARRMRAQTQQQTLDQQVEVKRQNELRRQREERDSVKAIFADWADEDRRIQEVMQHPENFVGKRFRGHR
jgi:hypothetical protein